MEFTYFKYSQNKNGLPEYTAYQMKLDTGGLFRGIRAEMDNKDNIVVFIDPNELPDEIAKGPIQIKLHLMTLANLLVLLKGGHH